MILKLVGLILAFGLLLLSASAQEQKTEIYVQTGHTDAVQTVVFSPNGKTIASGSDDGTIKLWDVASGQELKTLNVPSSSTVYSVTFSPDGKTLAASNLSKIQLWDVASGKSLKILAGHDSFVNSVAFSPDGQVIASASNDKTVKLWNVVAGKEFNTLIGHEGWVKSVAFSPDGKLLASGSFDKTTKLWDVASGNEIRTITGEENIGVVAFSLDGSMIATQGSDSIIIWDVSTGRKINTLSGVTGTLTSIAFSPEGKTLGAISRKDVILWDIISGEDVKLFKGHSEAVSSVGFSPDGKTIVSGSWDKTVKLWDVDTGKVNKSLSGLSPLVHVAVVSPDGKTFAAGSQANAIKLWNLGSGDEVKTLLGHTSAIHSLTFSPDGKTLASGGGYYGHSDDDHTIRLWDVANGKEIRSFPGNTNTISTIAFSPDSKILASGVKDFSLKDKTIKLWNVETGQPLKSLPGHEGGVDYIAFSPDGKILASKGEFDGKIKLWDINSGKELKSYDEFDPSISGKISAVIPEFFQIKQKSKQTPDGRFQIDIAENGRLNLQDIKARKLLASLITLGKKDWAVVTPDGLFDGTSAAWRQLIWRFDNNTFNYAPIEAFFKEFYYPGLLQEIMQGKTPRPPNKDLSEIDIRQPVVKITQIDGKPANSTNNLSFEKQSVKVRVEIEDNFSEGRKPKVFPASSGANDLRLFRNGSLVRLWKKRGAASGETSSVFDLGKEDGCTQIPATKDAPRKAVCETEVAITAGENSFTAYAFNTQDVKSNDATASVEGKFPKKEGTLYVLGVGVNKYANPAYNLNFAVPDVIDIGNAVKAEQQKLAADANLKQYARTEVITLKDETATRENILLALERFTKDSAKKNLPENLCRNLSENLCTELKTELSKIKPTELEDALLIYYAGHGTSREQRFYLLPHNYTGSGDEKVLPGQAVSDIDLNNYLEKVDAGRLLMVIDACQSGQALGAKNEGRGPMNSKGLAQLAYDKGMLILTATQSIESAKEAARIGDKEIKHGLLTYALLQGLTNLQADKDEDKKLVEREWFDYAVQQVPLLQTQTGKRGIEIIKANGKQNQQNNPDAQTPRVFYRREADVSSLILAKP